jgi:hypothetical protein
VGPADGWAPAEKRSGKMPVQLQKLKTKASRAPEITKRFLEQDQNTTNTKQQETLKNLLWFGHSKINKTTIQFSKNFMPRVCCHNIRKNYPKFIILSLVFE